MSRKINCIYCLPHELTGIGNMCAQMHVYNACNGLGKRCLAYSPETAESRKALAEAIAAKRKREAEGDVK